MVARRVWTAAAMGVGVVVVAVVIALSLLAKNKAEREATRARDAMVASAVQADALLGAAQDAVRAGAPERAVAILKQSIAEHPSDEELRLALAELLLRTGDAAGALEQYEAVLASGHDQPAELWHAAGSVARVAGRADRAVTLLAEAVQREPGSAAYAVALGQARLALGDVGGAKADLVRAGSLDASIALVWGSLAEIHLQENAPGLARDLARRARELEPDVAVWRVIEARALNRLGEPEAALAVLAALAPRERHTGGVLTTLGQSYGLLDRPADAAREYAEAWRADPARGDLAYEAALWFERAGETERAREMARTAVAGGEERGRGLLERLNP